MTGAGGSWDSLTYLRSGLQLESEISRIEADITSPPAISPNSAMLDSGCIVTPVAYSKPCRRSLAVAQDISQSTKSDTGEYYRFLIHSSTSQSYIAKFCQLLCVSGMSVTFD